MNKSKLKSKGDILIVDDIPENLQILFTMLSEQGYEVRRVLNGRQALKAIAADPPELVLLDIKMPDMDGYEVCQQLKASEDTKHIPIIFLSALNDILNKVRAFGVGGADYIAKPFHLEEVLSRVENQLTIQRQKKLLAQEIEERKKIEDTLREINTRLEAEIRQRQKTEKALQQVNQQLARLATLDGLTHIPNRRRFDQYLEQEWLRLKREQKPISLIMADVDFFKNYNDYYGHLAGDDCLKAIAHAISEAVKRPADLVARYGGEEFIIILPNTNLEGATQIANTIIQQVKQLNFPHYKSSISKIITISLGVTTVIPTQELSPQILVQTADEALYQAKIQGRDRFVIKQL